MGKQWKQWQTFFFFCSKITADGDCSHEIKRCSLLGRKIMTNLNRILKIRDISLPTKIHLVKTMVFPVVMYRCESWDYKEIWALKNLCFWRTLLCWRRLLRVPWTAKRSNQSIIKEISPEYSFRGLMLKLKLPIPWPADAKNRLTGKAPDAGKDWRHFWDSRGWDGWMASLTQWTWVWVNSRIWWWTGGPGMLQSMGSQSQT